MKRDNSNPAQVVRNMVNKDQKYDEKISPDTVTDFSQAENVVPLRKRSIIANAEPMNRATINSAKVAEIKQAIMEGRFKVNPEAVADRLLETVKELVQSRKNDKTKTQK